MKKVVSIALFGAGEEYSKYFPAWVRAFLNLHYADEGWRLRVHCDAAAANTACGRTITRLAAKGLIDVAFMGQAPLCKAMLWRLSPVFEKDTEYVWCRDLDCLPMPRDRACMEQFMRSGATVHTVHDAPVHLGVMGGLCGFHAPGWKATTGFQSLEQVFAYGDQLSLNWERKGADQALLNVICLCRTGGPLLEHRYHGWCEGPATKPDRQPGNYACQAYSAPTPNVGLSNLPAKDLCDTADRLAAHLGAPGFDHEAALAFWKANGNPLIEDAIRACE